VLWIDIPVFSRKPLFGYKGLILATLSIGARSLMRGFKIDRGAGIVNAAHGRIQNIRRDHYELAVDQPINLRVAAAFDELVTTI
jgi:hypothetical protein